MMYSIIMAGGSGTRFWPHSREDKSKQFLSILDKRSLIQNTVRRFQKIFSKEAIYIVAKATQEEELKKQAHEVPKENIIFEPVGRNTAPCIGLAAVTLQKRHGDGIMVVSPADHLIQKEAVFRRAILAAVNLAEKENGLVTIGITPDRPATGYGYIQIDNEVSTDTKVSAYKIKTFAEKPNLATAERFIKSGDFLWNSGIFVFRTSVFLQNVKSFLPDLYDGLMEIKKAIDSPNEKTVLDRVYHQIRGISMDYGIMEKAKNVFVVRGTFLWNDLGGWEQVYKLSPKDKNGNAISGDVVTIDTKNAYISSSKGMIAVLGLEDIIVVEKGGAILICKRDRAEDVKQVVQRIKRNKMNKYL